MSPRAAGWVERYIADCLDSSHASRTMELVAAVHSATAVRSPGGTTASNAMAEVGLHKLRERLVTSRAAGGAAAQNRILREWLATNRVAVARLWPQLGFPAAPAGRGELTFGMFLREIHRQRQKQRDGGRGAGRDTEIGSGAGTGTARTTMLLFRL